MPIRRQPKYQKIAVLRAKGLKNDEIARKLGMKRSAVEQAYYYYKKQQPAMAKRFEPLGKPADAPESKSANGMYEEVVSDLHDRARKLRAEADQLTGLAAAIEVAAQV
jgi:hypothetical protein